VDRKDVDRRRKKSRVRVGVFMGVVGFKVNKRKVLGFGMKSKLI
jgi:hypoxanthine-guanine phosphoribosyltransferase